MKRQRSRNRGGGGGGNSGGGGGGKPTHNVNRAFDSNGPDGVKIRGHAQHVFEKYQQLARDAQAAGDRVLSESYMQHAEHYFRVLRAVQPNRPASEIMGRDAFASGIDIDFEDDNPSDNEGGGETADYSEDGSDNQQRQDPRFEQGGGQNNGQNGNQNGGQQNYRSENNRGDRNGDNRGEYRSDRRPEYRQDNNRGDRDNRQGGGQDNRQDGRQDNRADNNRPDNRQDRDNRPDRDNRQDGRQGGGQDNRQASGEGRNGNRNRDDRYPDDRPRSGSFAPRGYQDAAGSDPLPVVEPEATPLTRERQDDSPILRSQDGGVSHAPAFLQSRVEQPPADTDEAAPAKPRRRRAPRPDAAAPADES